MRWSRSRPGGCRIAADFAKFVRPTRDLARSRRCRCRRHPRQRRRYARHFPLGASPARRAGAARVGGAALDAHRLDGRQRCGRVGDCCCARTCEFAFAQGAQPCFDIWEEEHGLHYYTLCVTRRLWKQGADWLDVLGQWARGTQLSHGSGGVSPDAGWILAGRTRGITARAVLSSGERSSKELDIAVILAAIHAGSSGSRHSVRDPRMHATLARLEALFDAAYPINHGRPPAPARRWAAMQGDVYYSGGAYYFSTLGAAEFCYRARPGRASLRAIVAAAGGRLYCDRARVHARERRHVRAVRSAHRGADLGKHLAWSYAAFISCVAARARRGPTAMKKRPPEPDNEPEVEEAASSASAPARADAPRAVGSPVGGTCCCRSRCSWSWSPPPTVRSASTVGTSRSTMRSRAATCTISCSSSACSS